MKRIYVKPELEVVMFSPESLMVSGSTVIKPGEGLDPDEEFSNKKGWTSNNWE